MMNDTDSRNAPLFLASDTVAGFQEVWYMRLNAPEENRALWLRYTVLIRSDHSKEVAEVWAIFFDANGSSTRKIGLKNTWPVDAFRGAPSGSFSIDQARFSDASTRGALSSDSDQIRWSFTFIPARNAHHDFVPVILRKAGLVKNTALTVHEHLLFTGWCEVNGERYEWADAPGMQGHLAGVKNGHSWAWGHCNTFVDTEGSPAPVIWDGLCARARVGERAAPPLNSMFIQLGETAWRFNTLRDALRIRSHYDFEGWQFHFRREGYRFEGAVAARIDDYAGVTYEDTDGSFLYCHNAKICGMTLDITNPDGEKRHYRAKGTVAYEVVSRTPNLAIPLVI